jgi:2-oxoglutarate ferredoxin oxidoreductase subunit alpha
MEQNEIRYELHHVDDADVVLIAYGTAARIAKSAVSIARERGEIKLGLIRPITLWPFPKQVVRDTAKDKPDMVVVEMSFGQMREDVLLSVCGEAKVSLLAHTGGGLPTEEEIIDIAKRTKASSEPIEVYPSAV